ncbi:MULTISPECIES: peptidoglycan-binding domain-containing protein [unclassified Streptomyces]|uniref:peptidoglycan-binding domain-containing protein n=1 Tax=unclassified Streptomyces TaxID=2593676 RepID=UPI002E7FFED4|nr:peptidoglycan-binding domain-containing protein [Streptomyces sp. NBC_00562]WTD37963.1 peptidoglycan-binding protein [Streptomyces sp. NBC_01643]WTD38674.1 peptidoglycan-binding protein [Streptomyces sp. NBC_01643]WUC24979.1 peptidoglycan-binding protein [Streptomyces sp. NBC_00562]
MRALTKALVSVTTAVGIAVGGLATGGTAMAAPAPAQQQTATSEVGTLAVVNLGLTTAQAKDWQCWLRAMGYAPGVIDGQLGTNSWKAAQTFWTPQGFYNDSIDGIVGPNTVKALQQYLNSRDRGYDLALTGIAGERTKDAFADYVTYAFSHLC